MSESTSIGGARPHASSGAAGKAAAIVENVERVIFGKREEVTMCVVGLLAQGHILLEDVPGTGKTTLARALARSVGAEFRRIQFTADLLPSDVLGVSVWSARSESFEFRPGPIFANVVLADELNRTTPRTQSSLLECMSEGKVTVDGVTRHLAQPFLVIATQNPLEFEGTYPLPESQLDRFLLRISLGYPDPDDERRILLRRDDHDPTDDVQPVVSAEELRALTEEVHEVVVDRALVDYILAILDATRSSERFLLGASPRGGVALYRAARALALIEGRTYCVPDDVKRLVLPVLAHRVLPSPLVTGAGGDASRGLRSEPPGSRALRELLAELPVPD